MKPGLSILLYIIACLGSPLAGQVAFEVGSGFNYYFPKIEFSDEQSVRNGAEQIRTAFWGPLISANASVRAGTRLRLVAGPRFWSNPNGNMFFLADSTFLRDSFPPAAHFIGTPFEVRYRINRFFSIEAGVQSAIMLNYNRYAPRLRRFVQANDFALTAGFGYHFGDWRLGLRYCHSLLPAIRTVHASPHATTVTTTTSHRSLQLCVSRQLFGEMDARR